MRFASYAVGSKTFYGGVAEGGMIALSPDFPSWPTLRAVIEADGFALLEETAKGRAVTHPTGSFVYEIPVPAPEKIICVGVNFPDRNAEYKDGQAAPANMSLFIRFPAFVHRSQAATDPPAGVRQARL